MTDATGLSVLTLAGGREAHLRRMVEALARSQVPPTELVVVRLDAAGDPLGEAPFPITVLGLPDPETATHLPLALARNRAAAAARCDRLLFLDADCMPSAATLGAVAAVLHAGDAAVCPEVLYLHAPVADDWAEAALRRRALPHPARPFPAAGVRAEPNPGLLWSLAFGMRAATLRRLGGFDERYVGYGAEDTDLGFAAKAAGLDLLFLGGSPVFHQYHAIHDPPLQHFADILPNARRFRAKWGIWPMDDWLHAFAAMGLIAWHRDAGALEFLRNPTRAEIAASRLPDGVVW